MCVYVVKVTMRVEQGGTRRRYGRIRGTDKRTQQQTRILSCMTAQTRHFTHYPPTTVTLTLTVSGVKVCKMNVHTITSVRIWTRLRVSQKKSIGASRVRRCLCVHLTSLSLFSYLLPFLPWLFLLSFFRSDWDLSRESCFILCSIWYLLNVACIRGVIHVSAATPNWIYLSGSCFFFSRNKKGVWTIFSEQCGGKTVDTSIVYRSVMPAYIDQN